MKLVHVQPVIMTHGEVDRRHPVEIGSVELALSPGAVARGLAEKLAKKIDHRIKDRYMRYVFFGAACLEFSAQISIDDTHQQDAGIAFQPGKDSIDMIQTANQGPDMLDGPDIRELRDTGARDLVHCFTR
jgi:hypothetical protein